MGRILVHEFMSLDGVIDAPLWTFDFGFDPRMGETLASVTGSCQGILLGRTTYQMFEPAWSTRTVDDDPGAPFFNDTMKYVVSGTLTEATWRNTEIIRNNVIDSIRALKAQPGGTILTDGSSQLVHAMIEHDLVDELHLLVYPLTLGNGKKVLPNGVHTTFTLKSAKPYPTGVVGMHYVRARV